MPGGLEEGEASRALAFALHKWTLDFTPAPFRHWLLGFHGGSRLGIDHRDAGAPLDVADKRRPKLRIIRQVDLICRLQQQIHPPSTFGFIEMPVQVLQDHVTVSAALLRIMWWSTEDLREEVGD